MQQASGGRKEQDLEVREDDEEVQLPWALWAMGQKSAVILCAASDTDLFLYLQKRMFVEELRWNRYMSQAISSCECWARIGTSACGQHQPALYQQLYYRAVHFEKWLEV